MQRHRRPVAVSCKVVLIAGVMHVGLPSLAGRRHVERARLSPSKKQSNYAHLQSQGMLSIEPEE